MTNQELLEFIAAQEKYLKDALAHLGRERARIQRGEMVTVAPGVDVATLTPQQWTKTATVKQ